MDSFFNRELRHKTCKGCGTDFVPPTFRQRFCDSCRGCCAVDGCASAVKAKGLCSMHLWRLEANGDLGPAGLINERQHGLCQVEGCENPKRTKGLCYLHYWRVREHGMPGSAKRTTMKTGVACLVDGCIRKAIGNGYCRMHYERLRNSKDLGGPKPVRNLAGEGHLDNHGYRHVFIDGRSVLEHRHVMERQIGRKLRKEESVHHRDGRRSFNAPVNLELWSKAHPSGQRVADKIAFAIEMLTLYPEFAAEAGYELRTIPREPVERLFDEIGAG